MSEKSQLKAISLNKEPEYLKLERLSIKDHPQFDEYWVQEIIASDPSVLGLGDLILKDKERNQPRGGRLDILLEDPNDERRYEVEIQLGKTDESHIIRTIEYWDNERKRFPDREHCAVIVAEEVTSRFFNVMSLFNGHIPLIAIQMNAVRLANNGISLIFTRVLDEIRVEFDEENDAKQAADRSLWEGKGSPETIKLMDYFLDYSTRLQNGLIPNYTTAYVGIMDGRSPNNFVTLLPSRRRICVRPRIERTDTIDTELETRGLEFKYGRWGAYKIWVNPKDVDEHGEYLKTLIKQAHEG
ncbi:MAG: hypothetical protein COV44_11815 [Deltaproteobacteria bacterium CG11_big_fil_rev_8_21_14_0_20_45_16]|nr:MAG: hypothetical protein COV44_11815 [Deltaproteobacteria bacterium CG11_big_fil_rev_8_21_14_0_20_45_16]